MNLPSLSGNWIDLVILTVILYFASEAFRVGFWAILANFISFLLSLIIALMGYQFTSGLLQNNFALSHTTANAIGFFLTAVIVEGILGFLSVRAVRKMPSRFTKKWWSKTLATVPAAGEGVVLIAFVLTLFLALPILPKVKADISDSKIGGLLVRNTSGLEVRIDEVFGGVVEDSVTYFTINPESSESVPLHIDRLGLSEDKEAGKAMFVLVNNERSKRGIRRLKWSSELAGIARTHATDMWERRYFGHVSPNGDDISDRLDQAEVEYRVAGENLAFAPTTATAHVGLMGSPGHKANILSPEFGRLSIGVIDNGIHGKIFVQVFTD